MDNNLIGVWAGIIWRTLHQKGKLTVAELERATSLEKECIYVAIGWLAREGNISFDNDEKSWSLHVYHEHYY